jgi:hypothetical protein
LGRLSVHPVYPDHDHGVTGRLSAGNQSTDQQFCTIADGQARIVVTKCADLRNSHLLSGSLRRLLVVATNSPPARTLPPNPQKRPAELTPAPKPHQLAAQPFEF